MHRRKSGDMVDGWVLLDKPLNMTSTRAVSCIRRLLCARKAGHAGTLDPLATGLLPIALGKATKTIPFVVDVVKQYRFQVYWGEERNTDDSEGYVISCSQVRPTVREIRGIIPQFTGVITQIPPIFSAIKINGLRAYDMARRGEQVEIPPRQVNIYRLELLHVDDNDHATFEIECSKGTYIRAIARDMGRVLGCFGHVSFLRRLRVGHFSEKDMIPLEKIEQLSHSSHGAEECLCSARDIVLHPIEIALKNFPPIAVSKLGAVRLRRGQSVKLDEDNVQLHENLAYATHDGILVAVGSVKTGSFFPTRVFE